MNVDRLAREVDVHLVNRTARTQVITVVDQDFDLATKHGCQLVDTIGVGHVQREQGDSIQPPDLFERRRRLPGLRMADIDRPGAGRPKGAGKRQPESGLAVRDQHPPAAGIEAKFAQLPIIGLVGVRNLRYRVHRGVSAAVEIERQAHPLAALAVLGQVRNDRGPGSHLHHAETPWQPVAKEQVIGMVQRGLGQQGADRIDVLPRQVVAETGSADLARRILDLAAIATDLQREPAGRRHGGETLRLAGAVSRRSGWLTGARHRVLADRGRQRRGHASLLARIAADEHSPRS